MTFIYLTLNFLLIIV